MVETARRSILVVAAVLTVSACPKRAPEPEVPTSGPPRAYQLLQDTPERESSQIEERREDVLVESQELDRTARVVATGETPLIQLNGARARLYGDANASAGWSVDNFVLLEIIDEAGNVRGQVNAGFATGVQVGSEVVDNVGRMTFNFDPGEVDLTNRLPERAPFKLRASALDSGGVGRVSDLYLVLEYADDRSGSDDELRD